MPSRRAGSFGQIAHIRALQRQAEEINVSRAVAVVEEQLGLREAEQHRQDGRERSWQSTMEGRFDLALARAWSDAITEGSQNLAGADALVADAQAARSRAGQALQIAHARAGAADDLERRARRRDRRARENRLLLEVSDLFARRDDHED